MKTSKSKSYQAAWNSEFNKLTPEAQATILASPDGAESGKLAVRVNEVWPQFFKPYYQNEILNRLANTVWNGSVFGEQTMLDMMAECASEQQFVEMVEASL